MYKLYKHIVFSFHIFKHIKQNQTNMCIHRIHIYVEDFGRREAPGWTKVAAWQLALGASEGSEGSVAVALSGLADGLEVIPTAMTMQLIMYVYIYIYIYIYTYLSN